MKANVEGEASASFSCQTSVAVKTKVEAKMTTIMKLIAGIAVWSVLLWSVWRLPSMCEAGATTETLACLTSEHVGGFDSCAPHLLSCPTSVLYQVE